MSAPTSRKRSCSEVSGADDDHQQPAKAMKKKQTEPEIVEDAQAKVKQLEQTIELARKSLRTVTGVFDKVPNGDMLGYLETLANILNGSSEGINADKVAHACTKQNSAKATNLFKTITTKIASVYELLEDREGVTADDYAEMTAKCVPMVDKMLAFGAAGVVYAFDLMLQLGRSIYGDLDTKGGSGYGDSEEHYQVLDEKLLQIMGMRAEGEAMGADDTPWQTEALSELVQERDLLKEYGIDGYFERSIKRLQELTGKTGRENVEESRSETGSESQSESESGSDVDEDPSA